jgi:hypothetical protein
VYAGARPPIFLGLIRFESARRDTRFFVLLAPIWRQFFLYTPARLSYIDLHTGATNRWLMSGADPFGYSEPDPTGLTHNWTCQTFLRSRI